MLHAVRFMCMEIGIFGFICVIGESFLMEKKWQTILQIDVLSKKRLRNLMGNRSLKLISMKLLFLSLILI